MKDRQTRFSLPDEAALNRTVHIIYMNCSMERDCKLLVRVTTLGSTSEEYAFSMFENRQGFICLSNSAFPTQNLWILPQAVSIVAPEIEP